MCSSFYAQTNFDSLYTAWKNEKLSDSLRVDAYEEYVYLKYIDKDRDSLFIGADKLINYGNVKKYPLAISYGYELKAEGYYENGELATALENYIKAYNIIKDLNLEKSHVNLINNLGALHADIGNNSKALEFFEKGLKISKLNGDKVTIEMCVSNIGGIYYILGNYDKALEYFNQGKVIEKELGNKVGYATSLNLISRVLIEKGQIEAAEDNIKEAITIFEKEDEEYGILEGYFILGESCLLKKEYNKALQYFEKCKLSEIVTNSPEFKAHLFNSIGKAYIGLKQYNQAKNYCRISLENAELSGLLREKIEANECLYEANRATKNNLKALDYLEQSIAMQDSLKTQETNNKIQQMEVEKQALNDSIQAAKERFQMEIKHQEEVQEKNRTRNLILGITIFIVVIAIGLFRQWKSTQKSKAIIEKEKERSDNLLLNILPADIAKELKEKGKADARDFDLVSILFTDFKGFTEASEKLSAKALVHEINMCFKAFDNIIGKYNIEKIKTIGDAYMAAGGLPVQDDNAVKNTVLAGLEMQDFITKRKQKAEKENKVSFEMRVGIHTGPIVAGIVGVKKFQYDIWGDTVNTASRMESSGVVGKVNISQDTYELIKNDPLFQFEHRGKISAKGKGEISMWFVSLK